MTYLVREGRHCGLTLALDSLKWTSVDIDIRSLSDYLIFKSQGLTGLSHDLSWLYGLILPRSLQNMKPEHFVVLTRRGAVGIGSFKSLD
ncbi:hypothetical protein MUP77_22625 [Candidatus Bathyarchaeota archaeon]|nr:hypothetical protein [Candidatus Bathyarchaeota archaeon]